MMKFPNRIIKAGDNDTTVVKAIQGRLKELGIADLQGTGVFGPKTRAAVRQFQALHRDIHGNPLVSDGKIGPITWQVLFNIPIDNSPTLAGAPGLLENAVVQAVSQIGVMEIPLLSNKGPEIKMYMDRAGSQEGLFWCAGFVYWCFDEAAISLGRSNPLVNGGMPQTLE